MFFLLYSYPKGNHFYNTIIFIFSELRKMKVEILSVICRQTKASMSVRYVDETTVVIQPPVPSPLIWLYLTSILVVTNSFRTQKNEVNHVWSLISYLLNETLCVIFEIYLSENFLITIGYFMYYRILILIMILSSYFEIPVSASLLFHPC